MVRNIIHQFAAQPRLYKQVFLSFLDLLAFPVILWLCYVIRLFDFQTPIISDATYGILLISFIAVLSLMITGVYRFIVHTFEEILIWKLALAVAMTMIALYVLRSSTATFVPMSVPFIFGFMMFTWVWLSRVYIRFLVRASYCAEIGSKRVAIYGAGAAGQQIEAALKCSGQYLPVFFIDDDPSLQGRIIGSIPVYPVAQALQRLKKDRIDEILLALPSVERVRKAEIIHELEPCNLKITALPGLTQLVHGEITVSDIQEVDIIDLLGRDPIPPISHLLTKNIENKVVMVTGAGGSIGSELCRQIVKNKPKALVLYELNEFALYNIDQELHSSCDVTIIPVLGSVRNQAKLEYEIEQYGVQTVYHAAAYKHVPLVECNPLAGLKNNAIGTACSLNAAVKKGVETFVLISTDKAVRPTNVMGASKRMAELYCQSIAAIQKNTHISIVRFGNVLGSSGSVVPLFKQQIAKGGPITVTHPEVTRYFMTIPEASQLVIQAGALGQGGDVFLLDMGEPVCIQNLARQMIKLSGFTVRETGSLSGDIEIIYSGLRPGEKLYEELLIDQENTEYTEHARIRRSFEKDYPLQEIQIVFDRISQMDAAKPDIDWLLTQLEHYVDGYQRSNQVIIN